MIIQDLEEEPNGHKRYGEEGLALLKHQSCAATDGQSNHLVQSVAQVERFEGKFGKTCAVEDFTLGPLTSRKAAEQAWKNAWRDLEQWRIQRWIERIPYHIQEVIRLEGGNEYSEGHPPVKRDKEHRIAIHHERQLRIQEINKIHQNAWSLFQCTTVGLPAKYVAHLKFLVGIQEVVDLEDLNTDEWRHMPETDQIVSVDPIGIVISASPKGRKKKPPKDGVQKRGRKPGPRTYKVRCMPLLTPGVSWEGVRWDGCVRWAKGEGIK
ncbi:hypothetical protein EV426DRAFT_706748 [Tirmania nivea]|nr:hypothetical protein EV426DRAFT_706748 [Tirmania nivea]